MTKDDFGKERNAISFQAGMNQRYHQKTLHLWIWWNRIMQISVGVLAVIGVCLAVAAFGYKEFWLDIAAIIAAGISAFAAIMLNVLPFGDWAQQHLDLFRRWTGLREDIDSLRFYLDEDPSKECEDRLRSVAAKVHRIAANEPQPEADLLMSCYKYRVEDLVRRGPIAKGVTRKSRVRAC